MYSSVGSIYCNIKTTEIFRKLFCKIHIKCVLVFVERMYYPIVYPLQFSSVLKSHEVSFHVILCFIIMSYFFVFYHYIVLFCILLLCHVILYFIIYYFVFYYYILFCISLLDDLGSLFSWGPIDGMDPSGSGPQLGYLDKSPI